jgi:asparagine synthase (glutamine-hydrolysing)
LAVSRRGYRHIESRCEPGKIIYADRTPLSPSVDPESCFAHWQKGPTERSLAREFGATAVFSGDGGDANLCSTSYVFAVDHSLSRYGLGQRTLHTAALVAARRDKTVWSVLADAWRRRRFGTSLREYGLLLSNLSQLVHPEARRAVEDRAHFPNPWFSSSEGVPLESLWRLGTLAYAPSFYDLSTSHHDNMPYSAAPLCAQPVFEVCRRIPVDIHFDQGRIRGLARRAFTHEVPEPILRRQWKDRPLAMTTEVVQRNLAFVREALLDGELTQHRILDRAAVEAALCSGPTRNGAVSGEILQHLDLALWIRGCLHGSGGARVA